MAIDAYCGRPRSGKSYSVVKNVILRSLKEGRHVYTNIPLTQLAHDEFPGLIHQLADNWFSDADLFDSIQPGSVVVLDELWRRWPKGLSVHKIPLKDKAFLAEHGHIVGEGGHTTRVVLVTQNLNQLTGFCVELVDKTYVSTKLDAIGASSKFRIDIYEGAAVGRTLPKSQLIRSTYDGYSESIWKYYKSATKSETDDVGDETRADKRSSIWRSPYLIFALVAPFVAFPLGLWYLGDLFSSGFGVVKHPEPVVQVAADSDLVNPLPPGYPVTQQVIDAAPAAVAPSAPSESQRWRVAGYIQRTDAGTDKMVDVAMLTDGQFTTYMPLEDCEPVSVGVDYRCMFQGDWVTPWSGPRYMGVAGQVLGSVPFVGGERSEQAAVTAQKPSTVTTSTNSAPAQTEPKPSGATVTVVNSGKPGHLW